MKSWILLALPVVFLGCGGGSTVGTTDTDKVYAQIEGLGDAAGNEQMFQNAFVEGAVPENREDYAAHGYQIAEEAKIEGDTATVKVTIFGGVASSQAGDRAGGESSGTVTESEQTWTLKRAGDEWKIQDAPLPE